MTIETDTAGPGRDPLPFHQQADDPPQGNTMRLSKSTETLKTWLAMTEAEIGRLKNPRDQQTEARLAHATKTREIIAGELKIREEEAGERAA
jgi:hypothetical protein